MYSLGEVNFIQGGASSDQFGYADDHQQIDTGSVYIFKRSGTTWSQTQKITPADGNQGDYFGFKVSVSNDYLVVSSEKADNQCANSGIVYPY
jgi:hypothetical protein